MIEVAMAAVAQLLSELPYSKSHKLPRISDIKMLLFSRFVPERESLESLRKSHHLGDSSDTEITSIKMIRVAKFITEVIAVSL